MAVKSRSSVHRRQPAGAVPINPRWLARGLCFLSLGNGLFWTKAGGWVGRTTLVGPPANITGKYGKSKNFASSHRMDAPAITTSVGFRSIVASYKPTTAGGGNLGRVFQDLGGSIANEAVFINTSAICYYAAHGSGTDGQWTAGTAFTAGSWQTFGLTHDQTATGNTPSFYIEGASSGVTVNSATTGTYAATSYTPTIGNRSSDNARGFNGDIGPIAIFDHPTSGLTAAEHKELYENIWQLLAPRRRKVPVAGGGSAITGALGTAVASGFTGTVNANRTIAGALGTASASGFKGNVNANRTVAGALGTAVASGFTGTVENSTDTTINGNLGVAVASGFAGGVNANRTIAGALGTAVASGFTGTVVNDSGVTITGNLGTAVASGFTGGVTWNRYIVGLLGTAQAIGFTGGVANGSPAIAGGGGWLPQTRRKSRKQIYEERVKLGILPPPVIKAAAKVAAVAQTVEEFKEERPKYEEMFLKAIKKTEWLPDYTRAIQAQLAIMELEEEELLLLL